ncbi:programmed cell death 6-interacting protein [Cydia amplana]|uniref:programmed cell death 6-interacting protein n=1 Tax=Cydia amplana TaxID=1869771 RepID=UPI002FE5AB4A
MAELIAVPLKKSADVELVKPLRNLLQNTYEGAEDCTDSLTELARLRSDAIWKVYDRASLDVLYSYYDQLASLEEKVPPQEVQIPFKWKDAFDRGSLFGGRISLTVSSLAYEHVCILFNIGALQSVLASQQPLDTEDSLKLATKLLQQAAGVFSHLKGSVMGAVHQEPTPDLQPDTLQALAALMLAQAQEVIAYKCIRDEMKEGMVARVCAQCEELYTDALRMINREPQRALFDREWSAIITAKQMAFRGLTQLFQGMVCRTNKAVGEEISRLQVAVEQLKGALGRLPQAPLLSEQLTKAMRFLAEATKDNDFIYHERIPDARQLEPVPRAAVAKALPPPARWGPAPPARRDLFAALLPAAAHRALQAAAARRAEAVNAEVNKLREATQLLNSILASLNLPACVEEQDSGELPESIRSKAAAVRAAGGPGALRALMEELPQLLQRNRDILDEAERMLREEEEADAALRSQFGARWGRTPSPQLTEAFRANAAKYRQIIDNAVRADAIVQQKFAQHKEDIELLGRSDGEITAGVPEAAGGGGGAGAGSAAAELRALLARVDTLKKERDSLENDLKDVTLDLKDQFLSALAADGALDEPALTAGALGAALAPLQRRAAALQQQQDAIVAEIQGAHARFAAAGGGGGSRGAALGRLCAAHDAYADLTNNLKEGVKFYNDLTQLLVTFQNKISDFCFARRTEKEELLKDLTQDASRVCRPAPDPPQAPAQEPSAVARKDPPPRPPPPSAAPAAPAAPAAAALPYPMQPQGMPLPYGAAPFYYAAPMPTGYNPYATLPYPHHAPRLPSQPYQPYQHPPAPQGYPQPPPHGYNPYGTQ